MRGEEPLDPKAKPARDRATDEPLLPYVDTWVRSSLRPESTEDSTSNVLAFHQAMDREALASLIDRRPAELRQEVLDYANYVVCALI